MRFFTLVLQTALVVADLSHEDRVKTAFNQIASITAPGNVKEVPLDGSGTLRIETKTFSPQQESFALVKSDSNEFKSPYNFVAFIRDKNAVKVHVFDPAYEGRVSVGGSDKKFQIDIHGVDQSESSFFCVISINDVLDEKPSLEVDQSTYTPNVYSGSVGAQYLGRDVIVAWQDADKKAKINFDNELITRPATDDEKAQISGLSASATVIAADRPSDDWFSVSSHREAKFITISTSFSSVKVLRFFNAQDVASKLEPVLVGWNVDFSCGPVPDAAVDIEIKAGNGADIVSVKKEKLSSVTVTDGYVQFPSMKATPEMDNKAGGLFCVFSNGPSILGISAPTVYTIHSAPSPRPNFDVKFNTHDCGLVDDIEQEIATCHVPKDQIKDVFPPIYLQWEVRLADGEIQKFPAAPEKTMSLALSVVANRAIYSGASIECVDYHVTDQNEDLSSATVSRTSPSNGANFEFRKLTDHLTFDIATGKCSSNYFGRDTATENKCSDVQSWEEPVIGFCPATADTPGHVNCTANMLNGKSLSYSWQNPECTDVDTPQLPCEMSSVEECPPPLAPHTGDNSGEAGGSLIWLLFFALAAVGGALLIFLNKRKEKSASQTGNKLNDDTQASLIDEDDKV